MLTRMMRKAVQANPSRAAIVKGDRRLTYHELQSLAESCASGLHRLGIRAEDCISVILPNSPEFVAVFFACARLRAIMLPVNPQFTAEEVSNLTTDARAKVIVSISPKGVEFTTDAIVTDFESLLSGSPDTAGADSALAGGSVEDSYSGPALYLYTSGSTDTRKRLCCTQQNLVYEALNFCESLGLTATDNILCTIPLYHSYGIGNCLLDAIFLGSTLVLLDDTDVPFASRCRRVMNLIRDEAIRFYPGVPYQFHLLSDVEEDDAELSNLRLCVSSGDVLPRQTFEQFLRRFGLPIRSLYGSTEAGSICINRDSADTIQFGSLGLPLNNVSIQIRDESGREVPTNEHGQIWVKSPVVPPNGYDNRPDLTAMAFQDGFYNTGDIGMKDTRGYLLLTGRKQTFVEVGGYKVDIAEVEEVLAAHPQVREAAALGVEVPRLGTLVKAVVVADGSCRQADIFSFCRERLASFKVPRVIEFRDQLPRSPLGKVLKAELGNVTDYLDAVNSSDFEQDFQAAATQGRVAQVEIIVRQIQQQAAFTLQCEPASITRSASFQSLGFDSLLATELHVRLCKLTGLPLSITTLWSHPSIDELAASLWSRMSSAGGNTSEPEEMIGNSSQQTNFNDLLRDVENLTDADIDALLRPR